MNSNPASQQNHNQMPLGVRPSSGVNGGALSNAGQMMMQSSNKKMNQQ